MHYVILTKQLVNGNAPCRDDDGLTASGVYHAVGTMNLVKRLDLVNEHGIAPYNGDQGFSEHGYAHCGCR
jgi:hypothetical protein